jgi:cysteine-rich repeat protein
MNGFAESYPQWQVSAPWQIDGADLTASVAKAGSLPASKVADAKAYVRAGYLVAELPDDAVLRLVGAGSAYRGFALKTLKSVWTANLHKAQDGTWKLRDGLVAGRMRSDDALQAFRGLGLCPGEGAAANEQNGYYQLVADAIRENADLRADGKVDASADCDAISYGIAFEAAQLTPGDAVTAPALVSCCPPGVPQQDCDPRCGDGRVNGAEKCDTAIAPGADGACPSACPKLDACTPQVLMGEQCSATCVAMPITTVGPRDGCCPAGANQQQDRDCKAVCGNGVQESGETCDPGNASCPACQPQDKCTVAKPSGAAESCNLACNFTQRTECKNDDGCCPNGCTSQNDSDCSPSCGNGVLENGELCDNGSDKPCPSSCDDKDPCTKDSLSGSAASCTADCKHSKITGVQDGDACCPDGANASTDSDCSPRCGNWSVEPGEECDDGNKTGGDGCGADCKKEKQTSASSGGSCSALAGTSSCGTCQCQKCQNQTLDCLAASSATESKECAAVRTCAVSKGCTSADCYCSPSNWSKCAAGMPDGPCHLEIEAAAHSPNPSDIFARTTDASYPLGRAIALGECLRTNCADSCK